MRRGLSQGGPTPPTTLERTSAGQFVSKTKKDEPLPTMHRRIRLAQYSLLHHSTKRRRVSRPTEPPSKSFSLLVESVERAIDGAGEPLREGSGVEATLRFGLDLSAPLLGRSFPCCLSSRADLDKLSRLPLPNFDHAWPGRLKCLFN